MTENLQSQDESSSTVERSFQQSKRECSELSTIKLILDQVLGEQIYEGDEFFNDSDDELQIIIEDKTLDTIVLYQLQETQIQFQDCNFNILDLTLIQDLEEILNTLVSGDNIIGTLILSTQIQNFCFDQTQSQIKSIVFQSFETIQSIQIEQCSCLHLCSIIDQVNSKFIDLRYFSSLKILKLTNICSDIFLPESLNQLEITQKERNEYKIINDQIIADSIHIVNFQLKTIDMSTHTNIFMSNCSIKNLIFNDFQIQKQLLDNNYLENICVNYICEEFKYEKQSLNNLIFNNNDCLSIKLFSVENIIVLIEQISDYKQLEVSNINDFIDLSKLTQLEAFRIQQLSKQIIFPAQIQEIHIQKLEATIKLLDLSTMNLLQKLDVIEHHLESIILPECNKKNFIIHFTPQTVNSIYIETFQSRQQLNFVDNVKTLKIKGLISLTHYENSYQNYIDFIIFSNLEILQLSNLEKQIKIPNSLTELYLFNDNRTYQVNHNFDFIQHIKLKLINLKNCLVDNLLTNALVNATKCSINFLKTKSLEMVKYCKIKMYESTEQKELTVYRQKKINSILFKNPEMLNSIILPQTANIVFDIDQQVDASVDFTSFCNLQIISLLNFYKKIYLPKSLVDFQLTYSSKNSIITQNLDFREFQNLTRIGLENCYIDNLITDVATYTNNCSINYFKSPHLEQISDTKINIYELSSQQECIFLDGSSKIQTVKIDRNECLMTLMVSGLKNIIFEDLEQEDGVLDFTLFRNLQEVYLTDLECSSVIFGSQSSIEVNNPEMKQMNRVDFSNSFKIMYACLNKVQAKEVIINSPIIQFKESNIKFLKLFQVADSSLYEDYAEFCKYIADYKNKHYNIIVKNRRNNNFNQLHIIFQCRMNGLYTKMNKMINE